MHNMRPAGGPSPRVNVKTIGDWLRLAETELTECQVDNAVTESEWLLGGVLGLDRTDLYLNRQQPVPPEQAEALARLLKRRKQREPLQYVLRQTEFMSCTLRVESGVFIPRPETELLAEQVSERITDRHTRIADIGTGSGAVAIALAVLHPRCQVTGVDIAPAAVEVARENARLNKVAEQIEFVTGDFWSPDLDLGAFDVIVSNPPYVRAADIDRLQPEISRYEPREALDGGDDGLRFYRDLAGWSAGHLNAGGWLALEMGDGLWPAVQALLERTRLFSAVEMVRDYAEVERVVLALKKE